ncbi:actin-like [Ischnura elegans]|uniref:actin-like n=1 Tax=Ischnura elegans TaxID=197161 RepID=UPI001ED8964B|nr:actin-like [Ischnura elegans]
MEGQAIVLDAGSGWFKAGFSGEEEPRAVFPTAVAKEIDNTEGTLGRGHSDNAYAGEPLHGDVVRRGVVVDWDAMETVWRHAFERELSAAPEEHRVLLTEAPLAGTKEKMLEVMFEKFRVPAAYVTSDALLSLYAAGKLSGLVVECGHGVASATPVHNGTIIEEATVRVEFAGVDLTEYLLGRLHDMSYVGVDAAMARRIKEKLCHVALDFEKEMSLREFGPPYELPDGKKLSIGEETIRCPEMLFRPFPDLGKSTPGIHEMAFRSLDKCDTKLRSLLLGNVVVCGGTTLMSGFAERMQKLMAEGAQTRGVGKAKVVSTQDKRYAAWAGGSMLAAMPSFQAQWISRREYEERGSSTSAQK